MINPSLDTIDSLINGNTKAKDAERVFTYFEFVKEWGFGDNADDFIVQYKEYLIRWNRTKNGEYKISAKEFTEEKLIDTLKSITLDYSSYEEQDFIANLDWTNPNHLRAVLPLYCRKIKEITEFYRQKRNEAHLIVRRNSFKGSTKSIEEIIYEKVFDYIFNNKNVLVSYADIKRDLLISVENYVDTYSEYFDIPRLKELSDKTRLEMLSANMNDVNWRDYLLIKTVISETLYSGNVFLKEIPLIALLGLDLTQLCVGDLLALRNTLVQNTTINLIPLTEQVALRRRMYEKFLGCDLYYLYTDINGDVVLSDVLCYAKNPTGNLLNCANADLAVTLNELLKLLSHIGLFFKPDKTSILKVNAKNYTYDLDKDNLQPDTVYIFPDPSKYGNIGNNKESSYPFIMRYKLDYDIKNMSSGEACDDPLLLVTDQGWRGYFSKQDEDFRYTSNKNFEYSFTSLANRGILQLYQVDAYGNQFGILKGLKYYDENGNELSPEEMEVADFVEYEFSENSIDLPAHPESEEVESKPILFNGGYFEDPLHKGEAFDFDRNIRFNESYNWSGIKMAKKPIALPNIIYRGIRMGEFGQTRDVKFEDHFEYVDTTITSIKDKDSYIDSLIEDFFSLKSENNPNKTFRVKTRKYTQDELKKASGELWVRLSNSLSNKPIKLQDIDPNTDLRNVISFQIIHETLLLEYENKWSIRPYTFDGEHILFNRNTFSIEKKDYSAVTYIENLKSFYFINLEKNESREYNGFKVDVLSYDCKLESLKHNVEEYTGDDFILPLSSTDLMKNICFSYNNSLSTFLLTYYTFDDCGTPYLYEHKFKVIDEYTFSKSLITNIYSTVTPDTSDRLYGSSLRGLGIFEEQ